MAPWWPRLGPTEDSASGADHVAPPSVERVKRICACGLVKILMKLVHARYRLPSLGPPVASTTSHSLSWAVVALLAAALACTGALKVTPPSVELETPMLELPALSVLRKVK